jgi:hypothetical protein
MSGDAVEFPGEPYVTPRGTRTLDILSLPLPGHAAEWNTAMAKQFAKGAAAILIVAEETSFEAATVDVIRDALELHRDALLGGRLFDAAKLEYMHHGGYWWSDSELEWRRENSVEVIPDPTAPPFCFAEWLSAAALVIPRRIWDATGGFDARFGSFLGDVDFCLRARRHGFRCLQLHDARFVTTRDPDSFDVVSEAQRRQSTLLLASRHGIPHGLLPMAFRQVAAQVTKELDRVDYWADYGADIGFVRRTLWFLRNCLYALGRERLRRAVGQTILCAGAVALRKRQSEVG